MEQWNIGLSPWIIQDGNYRDMHRGQRVDFALEFSLVNKTECLKSSKSAEYLGNSRYSANAQIVYLSEKVWVLDFGILASSETHIPMLAHVSEFVAVEFYLGIDPYFYKVYLHKEPGIMPLVYSWHLDAITKQKSPLIAKPGSTSSFIPDLNRTVETQVPRTMSDKWQDHNESKVAGNFLIEYILHCSLSSAKPKFKPAHTRHMH